MCTANLLLFISVYMLFPLLPFVMGEQLGVSVGQAGSMFLVFAVAMFAVGPFHAYLVDEYKGNTCSFTPHSLCWRLFWDMPLWMVIRNFCCLPLCRSMFRAGNHSGHYGGHRHNDFRAPQQETWYMHGLHAWACWWVLCWVLECIGCMVSVW